MEINRAQAFPDRCINPKEPPKLKICRTINPKSLSVHWMKISKLKCRWIIMIFTQDSLYQVLPPGLTVQLNPVLLQEDPRPKLRIYIRQYRAIVIRVPNLNRPLGRTNLSRMSWGQSKNSNDCSINGSETPNQKSRQEWRKLNQPRTSKASSYNLPLRISISRLLSKWAKNRFWKRNRFHMKNSPQLLY